MNKAISYVTAALVLFLAVGAFVLSYDALQALALDKNGVAPGLAWLWPLMVDGAVVVFSLAVLRGSLLGERVTYPWALVALFVALSVTFNVLHAPDDLLAQVIAAVPPVALALAFELFVGQVKSEVTRRGVNHTLVDLTAQVEDRRSELADLGQEAEKLTAQIEGLRGQVADLRGERLELKRAAAGANEPVSKRPETQTAGERRANLDQANLTRQEQIELRRLELSRLVDQDLTQSELADALGVSTSTVKRDLRALEDMGVNGRASAGGNRNGSRG